VDPHAADPGGADDRRRRRGAGGRVLAASPGTEASWIDHLYVHPAWVGQGIGTRLLALAQQQLPGPIGLHTFQENHRARRFYESRGLRAIAFGDGSGNEEQRPDILSEWRLGAEAGSLPHGSA
jgi:GNAT superfamily N-acetyltransferase